MFTTRRRAAQRVLNGAKERKRAQSFGPLDDVWLTRKFSRKNHGQVGRGCVKFAGFWVGGNITSGAASSDTLRLRLVFWTSRFLTFGRSHNPSHTSTPHVAQFNSTTVLIGPPASARIQDIFASLTTTSSPTTATRNRNPQPLPNHHHRQALSPQPPPPSLYLQRQSNPPSQSRHYTHLCPVFNSTILVVVRLYPPPIPSLPVTSTIVSLRRQETQWHLYPILATPVLITPILITGPPMGPQYTPLPTPTTAAIAALCVIPPIRTLARRRLLPQVAPLALTVPPLPLPPPRSLSLSTTVVRLVSPLRLARDGLVSSPLLPMSLPMPSLMPLLMPLPLDAVPLVASVHLLPPLLSMRRLTISALLLALPRFVPAQTVRYITSKGHQGRSA